MADLSSLPPTPAGYRFSPTDAELVQHYLKIKNLSLLFPHDIIPEIDLYNYNPWDLPGTFGFGVKKELYFFTPRDRKYPMGNRPIRRAGDGFWEASGRVTQFKDRRSKEIVGYKMSLLFYKGEPSNNVKTEWIMDEFQLNDRLVKAPSKNGEGDIRNVGYVLCKIYEKDATDDDDI